MALRIGILGAARIAGSFMVGAKATSRVEVVAVASRDQARGEAFAATHGIARACSYDELVSDPSIDAIYNPLPNGLHAAWSIAAARAGKHVLCEKPLALDEAEAQAMFAAADAAGVVLLEAFPYMFQPQTLELERLVHDGAIGEVRTMYAQFGFPIASQGDGRGTPPAGSAADGQRGVVDVRLDPALGGGALFDVGCYPLSFVRQIVGARPVRVSAMARWAHGVDSTLVATLAFASGVLAQISCSFGTAVYRRAIINGSAGVIETDFANHTDREDAPTYRIKRGGEPGIPFTAVPVARENGFRLELDAFADLVAHRDRAAEAARRAASLDNAWTLAAVLAAARG